MVTGDHVPGTELPRGGEDTKKGAGLKERDFSIMTYPGFPI